MVVDALLYISTNALLGQRLWQIRVLEAELAFRIRLRKDSEPIHMRLTVSNASGYHLDLHLVWNQLCH